MKKSVILFWGLFAGVVIFALGVQFAYSQSGGFATTTPSSGSAWHSASSVVCDNCITAGNIGDGAVSDAEVSTTANIHPKKIYGVNGWYFIINNLNNAGSEYDVGFSNAVGVSNWNARLVDVSCRPIPSGSPLLACGSNCNLQSSIKLAAGIQNISSSGAITKRWNNNVIELSQSYPKRVYMAEYYPSSSAGNPTGYQTLQFRAEGSVIKASRTFQAAAGFEETAATQWECMISYIV